MILPFVALLLVVATDEPAWRIEITTTGGFAGRGAGSLAVAADGTIDTQPGCRAALAAGDLKRLDALVAKSKPREWKTSYARPENPHPCCDLIATTLTLSRGHERWSATWYPGHLPLPADLDAIAAEVWSADPGAIRSRYKAQCR